MLYLRQVRSVQKIINSIILSTCVFSTLAFTPFINLDPVSPVKMAILGTSSTAILITLIISNSLTTKWKKDLIFYLLITNLILIWTFNGANKVEQFYGTIGRNYGLLSQFSLVVISFASMKFYSPTLSTNLKKYLIVAGGINMTYGTLQLMGEDFVSNWTTTYADSTRGFFANPNQYSSFTAMAAVASLSNVLKKKRSFSEQMGSIIYLIIAIMHLFFSKSTQGPVVFAVSTLFLGFTYLKINSFGKIFLRVYLFAFLMILTWAILDIFQKLPWKSILYSSTVPIRGDYWRAGIKMGLDHPILGVGLDKYLEWYRISRDSVTFSRPSSAEVSDSAHNLFIDYFASGGLPLFLIFTILNLLVIWKILRIIKNIQNYDQSVLGLMLIYLSYLMQSIISPIHLGMAIWGWVAIGLLLGFDTRILVTNKSKTDKHDLKNPISEPVVKIQRKFIPLILLTFFLGVYISSSFMIQDMKFRNSIKANSTANRVYDSAYYWPKSASRMAQASWLLYKNNEKDKSLKIALDAVKYSPNNYYAWLVLASRTDLNSKLDFEVSKNINRLEPRKDGIILLK